MTPERPQSIFRTPKGVNARFARIDNSVSNDERLSFRARGVAAYLLSKPDNWVFSARTLASSGTEGVDAIERAIREMITHGYITRIRNRDASGRIRSRLVFHEAPTGTIRQSVLTPTGTLPTVGQPAGRQSAGVKNDGPTNDGPTNDETIEKTETTAAGAAMVGGASNIAGDAPSGIDEVYAFADKEDIPRETAIAWWNVSFPSGFKIKGKPMHDWSMAFYAWAQADAVRTRPELQGMENKEFWGWIDQEKYPRGAATRFVQYNARRGWKRKNPKTGREEPIFDIRKAFQSFLASLSDAELLMMK